MQGPLSILGSLMTAIPRWLIKSRISGLIFKNRVVHVEINAGNISNFKIGAPGLRELTALSMQPDLRLVVVTLEQTPAGWANLLALRTALETIRTSGKIIWTHLLHPFRDALYVSSAADKTFVLPHSSLFWNGVGNRLFFYSGMLQKLGVVADVESAGAYKSFGESYSQRFPSAENRAQLKSIYGDLEDHMMDVMAGALGTESAKLKAAFLESPLSVEAAQSLGLVDGASYADQLLEKAKDYVGISSNIPKFDRFLKLRSLLKSLERFGDGRKQIAVLKLHGAVMDHGEGQVISPDQVLPVMAQIKDNDKIAAVVLSINSPGGSAVASDRIAHAIEELSQKKPVVALLENVAASGGYYIAARCHEIIAYPTTITGSIGVVGGKIAIAGGLERMGITSEIVAPDSESLGFFDVVEPFSATQRLRFRAFLQRTYDRFLHVVSMGRKLPLAAVESVASGRVWTGQQALEHKLVDCLGTEETALKHASRRSGLRPRSVRVSRISFTPSFRQRVMKRFGRVGLSTHMYGAPGLLKPLFGMSQFWHVLYRHPMEALMIFDEHGQNNP